MNPIWMGRGRRPFGSEDGSALILTICYCALALVVILIVAAATSLYLERKRLLSVADSAALVGAEAFDVSSVSLESGEPELALDPGRVHEAVSDFIAAQAIADLDALRIDDATSHDGKSATVTLSSAWRPPVLTLFVPDGIRLDATSVARSVFQ